MAARSWGLVRCQRSSPTRTLRNRQDPYSHKTQKTWTSPLWPVLSRYKTSGLWLHCCQERVQVVLISPCNAHAGVCCPDPLTLHGITVWSSAEYPCMGSGQSRSEVNQIPNHLAAVPPAPPAPPPAGPAPARNFFPRKKVLKTKSILVKLVFWD